MHPTKGKFPPPRKPSREELHFAYRGMRLAQVGRVCTSFFKWASLSGIAWCAYLSIDSLAGKTTISDMAFRLVTTISASKGVAAAIAATGVLFGLNERRLRKRAVKRLSPGRLEYEEKRDVERTSSGLNQSGDEYEEGV